MAKKQYPDNTRTGAIAIVSAIVLLLIARYALSLWSPSGGNGGGYASYRGPVLPMSAISGGEALAVQRHVDFDFSPYETADPDGFAPNAVILADSYELTNTESDTVTVQLAYPFEAALLDEENYHPAITANGAAVDGSVFPGLDTKGLTGGAKNWEDFKNAVTGQDLLHSAMSDVCRLDTPVILYKIHDLRCEAAADVPSPYLQIFYTCDTNETTVWRFCAGGGEDADTGEAYATVNYPTPDAPWNSGIGYLMVVGEDIAISGQQGYHTSYPGKDSNALEGMQAEIERTESTFSDAVKLLAQVYSDLPQYDSDYSDCAYNTPEVLYSGAMKRLTDPDYHTQATVYRSMDSIFGAVLSETTLNYVVFSLEIGSGETVMVEAAYHQRASRDHSGARTASDGYELATKLGSDLFFTALSASVSNIDLIEIRVQNFGFDPDAGITNVALDLNTERYYMDVIIKK